MVVSVKGYIWLDLPDFHGYFCKGIHVVGFICISVFFLYKDLVAQIKNAISVFTPT